jgi:hypothetical protein
MKPSLAVALAFSLTTVCSVATPAISQGLSEKEISEVICAGLGSWLKKKERSREFRNIQRKSRKDRTKREQATFDFVEIVREQYKKENCI